MGRKHSVWHNDGVDKEKSSKIILIMIVINLKYLNFRVIYPKKKLTFMIWL